MPTHTSCVAITLSPEQRVSGFVSASAAGFRLRLVVLPKIWRPVGRPSQWRVGWSESFLDLVGFEGDRVCIFLDGDEAEKRDLIQGVLTRSIGTSAAPDRLLAIDVPRVDSPCLPALEIASSLSDILALGLIANPRFVESVCEIAESDGDFAEWIEPILHAQYLAEVREALSMFRMGYMESVDVSTSPRGRIDLTSAAIAEAVGEPRVKFSHDDFRLDTHTIQVIRCALEVVASSSASKLPLFRSRCWKNREEARWFIDKLSFASRMPPFQALRIARSLKAVVGQRNVAKSIRLARIVLERSVSLGVASGRSMGISSSQSGAQFFSKIEIPTWLVWQELILKALKLHGTAGPGRCGGPWVGMGRGAVPDIVFQRAGIAFAAETVVLDAKYKYPVDAPSASDSYQLFAYSHLFDPANTRFEAVGLIYPLPASGFQTSAFQRTQRRALSSNMKLVVARAPWPSQSDLTMMDRYFSHLGASIVGALSSVGVWSTCSDRSPQSQQGCE